MESYLISIRSIICHIGSRSVITFHPTKAHASLALTPVKQIGTCFVYRGEMKR